MCRARTLNAMVFFISVCVLSCGGAEAPADPAGAGGNVATGGSPGAGGASVDAGPLSTGGASGAGGTGASGGTGGSGGAKADAGSPGTGGNNGSSCVPTPESCDGLDNDCDGIADDGVPGCDPCAPYHDLPVVTHWSNTTNGVSHMASDQAEIWESYPGGLYAPGSCYPVYAGGRIPDLDSYVGDVWSTTQVSDLEASDVLRAVCLASGVPVRLLRPDAEAGGKLVSQAGAVQVVHGLVIDGSMATVILPANWSSGAPAGTYPIVFNGYYDLNDNVFRQAGPDLTRMVALSTTGARTGAIGVLWNGGGAHASRTLSQRAQDQVASVIDYVATHFSGDRYRILTYGVSRGGVTALVAASNPKHHDYRVTFAAAVVPPTRIGEHSELQSPTYHALLEAVTWSTGWADSWRTGWQYPACAGKPHLTGKTGPEAHLYVITGTTDPAFADEHYSLIAPGMIAGLKDAGTEVYLEAGTHDDIVPYAHEVEYALALSAAGIPLEASVNLRAGHYSRGTAVGAFGGVVVQKIWEALQAYVDPALTGQVPKVTPGLRFFRVNRQTRQLESFLLPDGVLYPFSLEGPRTVARGERFPLVMVGEEGTQWQVSLTGGGEPPYVWTGTVPSNMKSIVWVDIPMAQPLGDYAYALQIRRLGSSEWVTIPSTNTPGPDGSEAYITLVEAEPNVSGAEAAALAAPAPLPEFTGTNWGLSEF